MAAKPLQADPAANAAAAAVKPPGGPAAAPGLPEPVAIPPWLARITGGRRRGSFGADYSANCGMRPPFSQCGGHCLHQRVEDWQP